MCKAKQGLGPGLFLPTNLHCVGQVHSPMTSPDLGHCHLPSGSQVSLSQLPCSPGNMEENMRPSIADQGEPKASPARSLFPLTTTGRLQGTPRKRLTSTLHSAPLFSLPGGLASRTSSGGALGKQHPFLVSTTARPGPGR